MSQNLDPGKDEIRPRTLSRRLEFVVSLAAACGSILYLYTAQFGQFPPSIQRSVITALAMIMCFLYHPLTKKQSGGWVYIVDTLLVLLTIAALTVIVYRQIRMGLYLLPVTTSELVAGAILIVLVLEATRRVIGWPIVILAIISLAYGKLGPYLPVLGHRGFAWEDIIDFMAIGTFGIFGMPLWVASTVIILFVIFAAFLAKSGASRFFLDFPYALFGSVRGGPAKLAVVSSGLYGTFSGSPTANVVSTGTFTIPLMKRTGYQAHEAGAIEAAASTGGILMPPVMGAVAFLMADVVGISYWKICVAAALPACLYYLGLFVVVDIRAVKNGLKGVARSELPRARPILLQGWFYLVPLVALMYLLGVIQWSAMKAALYATILVVICGLLDKWKRLKLGNIWEALVEGMKGVMGVTMACATAGIVIGMISLTGLAVTISAMLVQWSHGILPILLILTMVTALIFGMGLPTSASYLFLAMMVAPALIELGVEKIPAHLFIVYYATLACITPPVAVSAFAAAPIAKANPWNIGWTAVRMSFVAFIVPFFFIYEPALLLQGGLAEIIQAAITATIGVCLLATALEGYLLLKQKIIERLLIGAGSIGLVSPGLLTDLVGAALITTGVLLHVIRVRRIRANTKVASPLPS